MPNQKYYFPVENQKNTAEKKAVTRKKQKLKISLSPTKK
jgi:hypothetical protein